MLLNKENSITVDYVKIYSLAEKKIGIPIFQRFYAWRTDQVKQFKEDIIQAITNKSYQIYLLDFIFYEEDGITKIADGQQRLVTLNLLIMVINKLYNEKNNVECNYIKPFDISYDIEQYQEKYNTLEKYPVAPFKKVFLDLSEFIKNINLEDLKDIIENRIYVYMKKCSDADDAFNIFQQINTGGKPLTKNEVIKTAIDQYSKIYDIDIKVSDSKLRKNIASYYRFVKNDNGKNFDNMEIISFLRDYVTKDKETFKRFESILTNLNLTKDSPFRSIINYINRTTLFDVLNILLIKEIKVDYDKEYIEKVMLPLILMSISLTLNGGSPTTFRYLLNDVINMIKDNKKPDKINALLIDKINTDATYRISLDSLIQALGDINVSRNLKKAILITDVVYRNASGTLKVSSINLEHIYPQKPIAQWAQNGWPSSAEQQKPLIDNIGNYLLLSESVNKKIQNEYITDKRVKYEEIIKKDKFLQTEMNTVNFDEFENDRENYIKKRQREIAKMMQQLPLGKVIIK